MNKTIIQSQIGEVVNRISGYFMHCIRVIEDDIDLQGFSYFLVSKLFRFSDGASDTEALTMLSKILNSIGNAEGALPEKKPPVRGVFLKSPSKKILLKKKPGV